MLQCPWPAAANATKLTAAPGPSAMKSAPPRKSAKKVWPPEMVATAQGGPTVEAVQESQAASGRRPGGEHVRPVRAVRKYLVHGISFIALPAPCPCGVVGSPGRLVVLLPAVREHPGGGGP